MSTLPNDVAFPLNRLPRASLEWLWPRRLLLGRLTVLDGNPDQGKSLLTLDWAARITSGQPFPDGFTLAEPSSVILIGCEDNLEDTIVPRLEAAGADLSRVHVFRGRMSAGCEPGLPQFPEDCPLLAKILHDTQARLVIIDPLLAFLGRQVWAVNDQIVRRALTPLAQMAQAARASVVLVRHLTKSSRGAIALHRGAGAIAIIGAARTAFLAASHPDDPSRRLFACTKSNLAEPPPTLGYHIVQDGQGRPFVQWDGAVPLTANEILHSGGHRFSESLDRAVFFLQDLLASGPICQRDVFRQAQDLGISERTLDRAKARLKVESRHVREETGWVWRWHLPHEKTPEEEHAEFLAQLCRRAEALKESRIEDGG